MSVTGGVILFAVAYPHVIRREAIPDSLDLPPAHHVIDSLTSPIRVRTWTSEGIVTLQGTTIRVPGIPFLPTESPVLKELLARGVEVSSSDGKIYGLMPIWHSCGNDPIALHLAKVDVATILRVAEEMEYCDEVTEQGWDVECFYHYEERLAEAARRSK